MKVCALPYMCFCMLSNWIISFSASLLPSLRPQYGCTALQTAPGKRPQVALCVYISMLNKHVTPPPPQFISYHTSAFCWHLLCTRCHLPLLPPVCSNSAVCPSISADLVGHRTRAWTLWVCMWLKWGVESDSLHLAATWLQITARDLIQLRVYCMGMMSGERRDGIEIVSIASKHPWKRAFFPPPADINTHCDTNAITDFPHLANILADI